MLLGHQKVWESFANRFHHHQVGRYVRLLSSLSQGVLKSLGTMLGSTFKEDNSVDSGTPSARASERAGFQLNCNGSASLLAVPFRCFCAREVFLVFVVFGNLFAEASRPQDRENGRRPLRKLRQLYRIR